MSTERLPPEALGWLAHNYLLVGLLAAFGLALLVEMPWLSPSARAIVLQGTVFAFLPLLAIFGPYLDDLKQAVRRGPNPFLLALLFWCAYSAAIAPYRAHAAAELLRVLLGASVYFVAAYGLRPEQVRTAVAATLFFGAAMALYGFIQFGVDTSMDRGAIGGAFANHENFGSFLLVLLPPALALALDRSGEEKTLLGMQTAALVLGGALLLARTRAAWIGGAAALLTLSLLAVRFGPLRPNKRNEYRVVPPLVIVTIAFTTLIVMGQIAPLVSKRASTFARVMDDTSFSDRLHRWRSAARMASERPLTGWGLGTWPVMQGRWTHQGDDVHEVLSRGTSHSNLAHNFWVQWAAETGGTGLGLYVATIAAFILSALRALPKITSSYRKTLLMGCVASVAGAFVDGIGSPAYTFPGVSALTWLWMGIGIAAYRETRQNIPALPPTRAGTWLGAFLAGLGVALIVLGIGYKLRLDGRSEPRGTFRVDTLPAGSAPAGTRVLWTAVYQDPSGKLRPTTPGTVWKITGGHLDGAGPAILYPAQGPVRSGQQGELPEGVPSVTAAATYWDNYGRRYDASATIVVRHASP